MDLRRITYVLMISLGLSFFVRTTGTLFPNIFLSEAIVKFTIVVNTFFILVHVLFYVFFLKEYSANRSLVLKAGSVFAIVGSLLVAFIYIKNFCLVFDLDVIPSSLRNHYFDAIIPLVSSIFHLLFFSIFKKVQSQEEVEALNRPISSALTGIGIFIVLHLIVLINFLKLEKFNWLEHIHRTVAVGTIPFIMLAGIFLLYFYLRFYQFLSEQRKKSIRFIPDTNWS